MPFCNMMGLEDIIPSEISQTQKDKYCMIPLLCQTQNEKVDRIVVTRGWAEGDTRGALVKRHKVLVKPDE